MKKFFIPIIAGILALVGTTDLIKANLPVVNPQQITVQQQTALQQYETHETTEGLIEVSLATLIPLLNQFLSSKKSNLPQTYLQIFEQRAPFTVNKENHSDEVLNGWFNNHISDIMLIIEHEIGKEFKDAFSIKDFIFKIERNVLNFKSVVQILRFTDEKNLQAFEEHLKEVIKLIVEHKLHHIMEHSVKQVNQKSHDLQETINECFKIQIFQVSRKEEIVKDKPKYYRV